MNKGHTGFTHREYRDAKIIHLEEKDKTERFIYKRQEISKEEADEITLRYFEERSIRKMKKEEVL